MSPLQKIAMGLVFVIGTAQFPGDPHPSWEHYDGLADPVGWVLVIAGVYALSRSRRSFENAWWASLVAGLISLPMWFPQLNHQLDDSGKWALSLPQLAFCFLICRAIAEDAADEEPGVSYLPKRFGLLMWAFVVLAVLPPIAIGGDVRGLDGTTVGFSLVVNVAFIYYLFRVHRREWLGGPGLLEIKTRRPESDPGNDEGRPPSQ